MTIEEKANILLQDYRLRAENDYLNILNDIYIDRINTAIKYIKENADDNCSLNFAEELLDILKGENNE